MQPPRLEEVFVDTGRQNIRLEGFFNVNLEKDYLLVHKLNEQGEIIASLGYLNPLSFRVSYIDNE